MTLTDAIIGAVQSYLTTLSYFVPALVLIYFARLWWRGQPLWQAHDVRAALLKLVQVSGLVFLIATPGDVARNAGWSAGKLLILQGAIFAVIMGLLWVRGELSNSACPNSNEPPKQ